MPDTLLAQIQALHGRLPRAERVIAELVLEDPAEAAECTISELAARCGVSDASVHRFCRTLGLRGYPQLRLALAAATEPARGDARAGLDLSTQIEAGDAPQDLAKKIGHAHARAVQETVEQLDGAVFQALIQAVAAARRVLVFGVGSSALAAQDCAQKLVRLGYPAVFFSDVHAALMCASGLHPADLAVAVSHSGRPREVVEVLDQARSRGAGTAVLTSDPKSPAAARADLVALTAVRQSAFRDGGLTSRIAQLTLVDCLYVALAQHTPDALENLERAHDAVRSHDLRHARRAAAAAAAAAADGPAASGR